MPEQEQHREMNTTYTNLDLRKLTTAVVYKKKKKKKEPICTQKVLSFLINLKIHGIA
jgi:hypothetical protein